MKNIQRTNLFFALIPILLLQQNKIFTQTPDCFDPGFGLNGVLKINTGAEYELGIAMDYQSDGSIIIAGNAGISSPRFFVQRYRADGTPDISFGKQGGYTQIEDPNSRVLDDVLVLPNDYFLVSFAGPLGHFDEGHFFYKFKPNGMLDSTFGQNGAYEILTEETSEGWSSTHLASLPNGQFIAAGNRYGKIFIARFNADASPDSTFGNNGILIHQNSGLTYFHFATLICEPNGNIWIGGYTSNIEIGVLLKYLPDGSPDNDFGTNGIITQQFFPNEDTRLNDFKILSNGKIVTMSTVTFSNQLHLFITQYLQNGLPDLNFGTNGTVHETLTNTTGIFNDLMILPNGNILSGGRIGKNMAVFQHLASGEKKMDFGVNGLFIMNYGNVADNEILRFSKHLLNAKIYALGYTVNSYPQKQPYLKENDVDITLTRFNPDISLDSSYGFGGKQTGYVRNAYEIAFGLARQDDGKIIVVTDPKNANTIITRFWPNGQIDRSFGNFGKISLEQFRVFGEGCIKIYNSTILLGGRSSNYAAVYRLHSTGMPDLSFGINGKVELKISDYFERANAVEIQNGKILLAGSTDFYHDSGTDFKIARFNSNGTLDLTFGSGGIATIPVGTADDEAHLIKMRNNGKIVLIGDSKVNSKLYASFAQLDINGVLDNSFGINGKFIASSTGIQAFPTSAVLLPDDKIITTSYLSNLLALQITKEGTLDSSFSQDGFIESYSASGPFAISPHAMAIFKGSAYFGGHTNLDQLMLLRTSPSGALSNPCSGSNISYQPDVFPGFNEEIYAMLAESDSTMLLLGNANSSNLTDIKGFPLLLRFIPNTTLVADNEPFYSPRLRIIPNPAKDGFFIEILDESAREWQILLTDSYGIVVQKIDTDHGQVWVERRDLPAGIYFYTISSKQQILKAGKIVFVD